MDSTKRALKFQNYDFKKSVGVFWGIVLLVNILTYILIINFNSKIKIGLFSSKDQLFSIVGGNIMPIFIFFIVYGIVMYHEEFALALSLGVTRKDFYKSAIVDNILVVIIFAVIQSVSQIIDKYIVESLGYKQLVNFGIFNVEMDSILFIVLTLFMLFLGFVSITNLLGVLQYRFGYKLWIGFGIILLIGQMLWNFLQIPVVVFSEIYLYLGSILNNFTIFIVSLSITIISYTLGYFLIRKANIKK